MPPPLRGPTPPLREILDPPTASVTVPNAWIRGEGTSTYTCTPPHTSSANKLSLVEKHSVQLWLSSMPGGYHVTCACVISQAYFVISHHKKEITPASA